MKKSFADILGGLDEERSRKIRSKLPQWADKGLTYPTALCLEQCSSSAAALLKADLVHGRVADLTGGLGVDSWAFSQHADAVFYNEMNTELHTAVESNFAKLEVSNIECHGFCICAEATDWAEALKDFRPDFIYLDPARRNDEGRKVFLLEDCRPDVLTLLPTLREITPDILIKLSPMADLAMLSSRLGKHLREILVIGFEGEVKELLCILDKDVHTETAITAVEQGATFGFSRREESEAAATFAEADELAPGSLLLEPRPTLLKAGAFRLPCSRFGLKKLAPFTHLYTSSVDSAPAEFFKKFEIISVLPFNKAAFKEAGKENPHAEVSARNIPLSSEQLRSRLGIRPGPSGGVHIFGCTVGQERFLIVSQSVQGRR